MPQDIDGAIARWRKANCLARRNGLIMRPANAAKRRLVALLPSRGATAQDSTPDDDVFQVRKPAAFGCGLRPGSRAQHILRAFSGKHEATLESAVVEVVAVIIRICTTLFGIAQGRPQACDPPGWNGFEGRSVHLFPPADRCSRTIQGRNWPHPEFPLNCCRAYPASRRQRNHRRTGSVNRRLGRGYGH